MNKFVKAGAAALVLGATTLAVATPAEARPYRHYRHHHDNDAGLAIGAGILGLAIGAAIASDNDRYYDPYYGRGYYNYDPYYRPYYGRPYYRGYARRCVTRWRFNPYWGRQVRVRYCG